MDRKLIAVAAGGVLVWALWPRSSEPRLTTTPVRRAQIDRSQEIVANIQRAITNIEQGRSESIAEGRCTEWLFDAWGGAHRYCESLGALCTDELKQAIIRGRTTCDRLGYS